MNIDDLLRIAMERRASDLHLKVGNYPHLRIDGELHPLTDQPRISAEDMLTMAFSIICVCRVLQSRAWPPAHDATSASGR